jgi:hypothetical protein
MAQETHDQPISVRLRCRTPHIPTALLPTNADRAGRLAWFLTLLALPLP